MEIIKYEIKPNDTLASIAKKNNISVEEMLKFHNENSDLTHQIYSETIPFHITHLVLNHTIKLSEITLIDDLKDIRFEQNFTYRTEMTVGTVLESIMVDNSTCKSQYRVGLSKKQKAASVVLEENHVTSSPEMLQAGMQLIADIDKIKCNSILKFDSQSGKIEKVVNYEEIISNWNYYKKGLNERKSVLKLSKKQKDIDDFITGVESTLNPEKKLIEDYYNKMFYELFFSSSLVGNQNFTEKYSKSYYSTLFDGEEIMLHFTANILEETDEIIKVRRVSAIDLMTINMDKIIQLYNERIMPMVKYSFSSYNYSYRETFIWNKKGDFLQQSHITVVEEVKNNIQLLIDFNLKKLE